MLREMRETKGLSQQQLADALSGMWPRWTQADVSRIESGKIRPTINKIKQAADFFGVTQGTMLGEEPIVLRGTMEKNKKSMHYEQSALPPTIIGSIGEVSYGPDNIFILGHANGSSEAVMLNVNEPIG